MKGALRYIATSSTAMLLVTLGLLVTLPLSFSTPSRAQPTHPEVQIDTSVLEQLAPAGGGNDYSRPILSRPATGAPQQRPVLTPSARPQAVTSQGAAPGQPRPYAVRRPEGAQDVRTRIQQFPVQSRTRTESNNPGAEKTQAVRSSVPPSFVAPAPVIPEIKPKAVAQKAAVQQHNIPLPGRKPARKINIAAKVQPDTKPARTATGLIKAPLPPEKPDGLMAAIARGAVVNTTEQLNAKPNILALIPEERPEERPPERHEETPPQTAKSDTGMSDRIVRKSPLRAPPPPPARRSAAIDSGILRNAPKTMPAVPAERIGAEQLPSLPGIDIAGANDPLMMQLQDFSRDSFVENVERLTAANAPVPERKPARGMPPPLRKQQMAVVVPSHEISSPDAIAAIEPAAGGDVMASAPLDRTPRPPPGDDSYENAFITVPFMPGTEEADAEIKAKLDSEVLPLLRQNPEWRVQIQAFSSPDNEIRSSARRTALSRALSVREYLMSQGIEAPRMDIRALGMETDRNPLDRIDMVFFDSGQQS